MPVNVKVINTKDFIKTTATGILDFAASKQAILDIASQIKQPGEYEVLVDTREAEVVLSMVELFELGEALANHPSLRRSKIGLLTPKKPMDNPGFLELVAKNRGIRIKAFTDFEQAITWLVMQDKPS
ncbi:MAG TPA: hypothetical protein VIN60_10495 [Anaerolineales bacterium]